MVGGSRSDRVTEPGGYVYHRVCMRHCWHGTQDERRWAICCWCDGFLDPTEPTGFLGEAGPHGPYEPGAEAR